jgi:hypothetical protein
MERTMRPREGRTSMLRRTLFVTVGLAVLGAGLIAGSALATSVSGASAETARGPLVDRSLDVTMDFENGSEVELKTKGPIEVAYQRIPSSREEPWAGTATRGPPWSPSSRGP